MDLPKFTSNKEKGGGGGGREFEGFGEKLSFSKILIVTLVWQLKSYSLHIANEWISIYLTIKIQNKIKITITTLIFL